MWQITRPLPYRRSLIVGCGAGLQGTIVGPGCGHVGQHLQADTLDVNPNARPDIVGDICDPQVPCALWGRYKFIVLEFLPDNVFQSIQFFENIDRLRSPESMSCLVFIGPWRDLLPLRFFPHWQTSELRSPNDIPPQLRMDPYLELRYRYICSGRVRGFSGVGGVVAWIPAGCSDTARLTYQERVGIAPRHIEPRWRLYSDQHVRVHGDRR